jgi:CBS domain-containing protein
MEVRAPLGSYLTPSFERARVRDAMRSWVLTCDPATPLVTIAQRMASEHVHAIVVLDDEGDSDGGPSRRPGAVLTDRDLLRSAERLSELTAGEVATGELLRVHPDDPLPETARRMAAHGVSHAVVVDDIVESPVGVLSTLDVAGVLAWGEA